MENNNINENTEPQVTEPINEIVEEPPISLGEAVNNTLMDPEIVPEAEKTVVEEPVAPAPVVEEPVAAAPVVEEPVAAAPVVEEPVAAAPVVEEPVAAAPVVEEPVAAAPVVEEPVAAAPVVEEPVAAAPVVEEPVAAAPVVEEPVAAAPVVEEPVVAAPVAEEPVAQQVAGSTDVKIEEPKVKPPKSHAPILFVIIIILALVLCYLLFGDKIFKKEAKPAPTPVVSALEFASMNSIDFLRLKSDGTYDLNLTNQIYKDTTLVRDKKGKYTKVDNTYTLDNGAVVIVNNDYAEVTNLVNNSEEKYEDILFEKTKLETVRTAINTNVVEYFKSGKAIVDGDVVKSEAEGKKAYETEVSNFAAELGSCYRLETGEEAINKNEFNCTLSYKIYLKDYTQSACSEGKEPYLKWLAPSGHCESDHISHDDYLSLSPSEGYKILSIDSSPV